MESSIHFIQEQRRMLVEYVNRFTEEQLNQRTEPGKWSAMQVLEHLYLIEKSITAMIQKHLDGGDHRSIPAKPIHLTVDRSTKVDAPAYVIPSEDIQTWHSIISKLDASRHELLRLIQSTQKQKLNIKGFSHPVFGLLSLDQWVEFIGYHEKRHLLQIEEIMNSKTTAGVMDGK
ncbi:DinB family protein [Fictibacillus iocasae]|uniref:DinB family protein n=1 Tax=Fictibacillus iocasae TaxID=2715437 RepID=A0ABW2NLW3_9BACL